MQKVWKRSWSAEGSLWGLFCPTLDPLALFTNIAFDGKTSPRHIGDSLAWVVSSNDLTHWATRAPCFLCHSGIYIYLSWVNGVYSTANKMKIENVQMRVCLCMQLLRKSYCDHVLSVVRLNHFRFLSWSAEGSLWGLFYLTLDPPLGWPGNHNTCRRPWVLYYSYQVSSKSIKQFWRRNRKWFSLTTDSTWSQ
jgi:hypothetical protein